MEIQKWEYTMAYINLESRTLTVKRLNEMGEKGWELISNSNDDGYGTFKRPVQK